MKWNPPFLKHNQKGFCVSYLYYLTSLLPLRFLAHTTRAAETNANEATMAIFSAIVVSTAIVLRATAGISPTLTMGFKVGWTSMN